MFVEPPLRVLLHRMKVGVTRKFLLRWPNHRRCLRHFHRRIWHHCSALNRWSNLWCRVTLFGDFPLSNCDSVNSSNPCNGKYLFTNWPFFKKRCNYLMVRRTLKKLYMYTGVPLSVLVPLPWPPYVTHYPYFESTNKWVDLGMGNIIRIAGPQCNRVTFC